MIESIIRWSVANRLLIVLLSLILAAGGGYVMVKTPVDAIPDLSDVQVIVKTSFPGQAPQVVEDQVTYPLTTAMLAVPGAETVRGYSMFGDSYVYVIFEDGTDIYWARSRVLEYLNGIRQQLPSGVEPTLGPDATGVGWVYEYSLTDFGPRAQVLRKRLDADRSGRVEEAELPEPQDMSVLAMPATDGSSEGLPPVRPDCTNTMAKATRAMLRTHLPTEGMRDA